MRPNPIKTIHDCFGNCTRVPDEVCLAVLDSLQVIPEENCHRDARDARAVVIALRMAMEGWQFCPCFAEGMTPQHAQIFDLVQTNLANNLAHGALLRRLVRAKKLKAA
jgi:hypothetical protein